MFGEEQILRVLADLNIPYQCCHHPPVFTAAEARLYENPQPGDVQAKNLFLRNKRRNRHFLLVVEENQTVDLRVLAEFLGESGLGLASSARLQSILGVAPGAVGIFGLVNDVQHTVVVVLAQSLTTVDRLGFHPNINTATVLISGSDMLKFIRWAGNPMVLYQG